MTLPKGFGTGGGASSSDVSKMIGRRIENHAGIITGIFIGCWLATWAGVAVATVYYPWAYPPPSAHYALTVLTIIESIGYLFCIKVATEGTNKARTYNGLVAGVIAAIAVATIVTDSVFFG
ncbi:MAG: hypothetical protein E6K93_04340 [Thaumarchaeota archaeon]|nr:MAG: hypothetical protein AUI61_00635 [Thaumarchaeota archaeon 13_1_40CM_2_39_13_2]OLE40137.1 MAG: hypothetical protein AUG16_05525 [Thaumarchaeota archaeon 13_1_20CM_2_39_20]TLX92688.1 MAG: hypothetical protein E6K93_04340 [Nitrososphaerota archaeon]